MLAYMEARCSGGEVGSGAMNSCHQIGSCKTISPPEPRRRRTLSVAEVEANRTVGTNY